MNILFLIYKWRIKRKIQWIAKECQAVEQELNRLTKENKDYNKISIARIRLEQYRKRLEGLKIKYGIDTP